MIALETLTLTQTFWWCAGYLTLSVACGLVYALVFWDSHPKARISEWQTPADDPTWPLRQIATTPYLHKPLRASQMQRPQ